MKNTVLRFRISPFLAYGLLTGASLAFPLVVPAADFTFSSGTYIPGATAPEPLVSGDVLNLSTGSNKIFDGTTLTNQAGTVNWNVGGLFLQNGALIFNQSLWDAKSDSSISNNGGTLSTFDNSGTFRKSAGAGTTTIGTIAFVNSGIIDAQTGILNFSGGNTTFNAGSTFTGAGSTRISNNAAFNGAFTSSNLNLVGGTYTGASAQIDGTVNFGGGSFTGTWQLASGQTLNAVAGANKLLDNAAFINNGTVQWQTANALSMQNNATFTNNALFDIQNTTTIVNNGGVTSTFTNSATGVLRTAAGETATIGTIAFINHGGTLQADGILNFNGGNTTFNAGSTFTGAGSTRISNNAAFNGAFTSSNLNLVGGTYTGASAQIDGTVNFGGGSFTGTWQLASGQTLNAVAGANKLLDNAAFINNGTVQWQTANALFMQNGATFNNAGTFAMQNGAAFVNNGGILPVFTNSGAFNVAAGQTGTIGGIAFVNNGGSIDVDTGGILNFSGGNTTFNAGSQFTGAGSTRINANATFNGAFTSSNLNLVGGTYTGGSAQINGTMNFGGGSFTGSWQLASGQTLNAVTGSSKILDNAAFTNNGTVQWQTANTLFMQNGATFNNDGTFVMQNGAAFVNNGGILPVFTNSGAFNVAAGQTGTIGTIAFVNNGGSIDVGTGGSLVFAGGNATFNHGTHFTGPGVARITNNASFNGDITSQNLVLAGGTITGGAGATLIGTTAYTAGTLAGNLALAPGSSLLVANGSAKIITGTITNQGTIAWQGSDSLFMQNGGTLNNNGMFDMQSGMTISNNGGAAPSINNSGTFQKTISAVASTVGVNFTNSGLVNADTGSLTFTNGIQGTAGTIAIAPTGTIVLGAASSTGSVVHNGSAGNSLTLGGNTLTVHTDYNNANFGTGNSFNRRANVSTSAAPGNRIIAAGDANQGVSGAQVSNGTSTTPTLTIGNVHVGANTVSYDIVNTGTTGPALRGAIQTSVNGASLTDGRLSGSGVTAGNWGPVSVGGALSQDVTFNVASAGIYTQLAGQSVSIVNNFDNTRSQLLTINSAAGAAAYQLAAVNTLSTPVDTGSTRIGGTLSTNLAVTNIAPNTGGYTETLGASVTGTTGGVFTAGSVSTLAQGGTSNAISAGLNTATAGAKSGTATLGFTSHEINGSGLGTTTIGSQAVNLTGAVYQAAVADTLATPVHLGNARVGGALITNVSVTNIAPNTGGYTETLGATVSGTTGGVTTGGSVSGLAQGGTSNAISAGLNTSTAGSKSGSATLAFTSSEINGSGLGTIGVGSQTVNLTGNVFRLAEASLGNLNFGNVLVGSSQTRYLSVANTALGDGFSEGLDSSLGLFSGASAGLLSSSGAITNLAAGGIDTTSLAVTLNTSASGLVTASVQVLLASNGATTSGLGIFALPSQAVSIDGLIEATVGNLASASAATPNPVNLGNVRVGDVAPSQVLTLTNTQVGPGEGLNAGISTASAGLTAAGSFSGLAPGGTDNSSLVVSMNTASAGSRNGTATIALESDGSFNSGVTTALGSQLVNVTGAVYQTAAANVLPASIDLGTIRAGTVVNTAISLTNTASDTGGHTETLSASVGTSSPGLIGAGSVSGLAAGASSNALSLQYTAGPAGAFSGTTNVNFLSQEINGSGLGDLSLASQTVNVLANVNAVAAFGITNQSPFVFSLTGPNSASLDFGTVSDLSTLVAGLTVSNIAFGPSDSLLGSFNLTGLLGSPFTLLSGTSFDLAAGAGNAFSIHFNPSTDGNFSGVFATNFSSHNAFQSDLDLGDFVVTVSGRVATGPSNGRVPDSPVGLVGVLALLATLVAGHRYGRRHACRG